MNFIAVISFYLFEVNKEITFINCRKFKFICKTVDIYTFQLDYNCVVKNAFAKFKNDIYKANAKCSL